MSSLVSHPWYGDFFADPDCVVVLSAAAELARFREIEIAWTRARADAGLAATATAEKAAAHIAACPIDDAMLRDGVLQDGLPIPAFVRALKQDCAEDIKAEIHTGLTSQDVMDTALVLALQAIVTLYDDRLQRLGTALDQLCKANAGRALMGYTRMQAALPITADLRISNWLRPLRDQRQRLSDIAKQLAVVQWGGPVGARDMPEATTLGSAFAKRLGLSDPGHAWHTTRDGLVGFAACLTQISGSLGKMGQDIALMAQRGADDITLKSGGSSSAMPHKQNPILAELLVTLATCNATQMTNMNLAMIHEQERSGTAWLLEMMALPDMMHCCGRGLMAATDLIAQIESIGTVGDTT